MLAQVIVDVPLMQTDKSYSYQVPEEFSPFLEKGMRVHVPFGKGNRLFQEGDLVGKNRLSQLICQPKLLLS